MMSVYFTLGVFHAIQILLSVTNAAPKCPNNYQTLHDRLCYRVGTNKVVWTDANRACQGRDATLASVKTHSDLDDLRQIVGNLMRESGSSYIGLIDPGDGSGYANFDKSSIQSPFWESRRSPIPQQFGDPRCAFIDLPGAGKWKSGPCGVKRRYICTFVPYEVRERVAVRKRLRCHVCSNERTNDECNARGTRLCAPNAGSCQNEVRVVNGRKSIFKRCKQTRACENNYLQNSRAMWLESQCKPGRRGSSVCRCCCQGNECNAFELPCLAKGCIPLRVPNHGRVSCTDDYMLGSLCNFTCDFGFTVTGSRATRCVGEGGKWSSPVPTCIRTRCLPVMTAPNDGSVKCTDVNRGSSLCRFTCKYGYYLRGLSVTTCLASGKWSVEKPTCELIRCSPPLKAPTNGRILNNNPPLFGAITMFQCDDKYFLVGSPSVRCTDRDLDGVGDWTAQPPICRLITCSPALKAPPNARLSMSTENDELGSVASFECRKGYFLRGNATVVCEGPTADGFGRWSQQPPKCEVIKCPEMTTPLNGREIRSTTAIPRHGTVLTFSCKFGYFLIGSDTSQCGDYDDDGIGEWTEPPPTCKQIRCPGSLKAPTRGHFVINGGSKLGAVSEFTCSEGYFMIGRSQVKCQDMDNDGEGEWSHEVPTCKLITCLPMMEAPSNGDILCTEENEYGTRCLFMCNFGFFRSGSESTSCTDEDGDGIGDWSQPRPTCVQILCRDSLIGPENGEVQCSDANFLDSRCRFSCDEGYWMLGSDITICTNDGKSSDGRWTEEPPTCSEIMCDNAQTDLEFGSVSCNDTQKYGSVCEYSCDVGYHLSGKTSVMCRDINKDGIGEWDNDQPVCKQSTCSPKFEKVRSGQVTCSDGNGYGSLCSFKCDAGHDVSGSPRVSCGEPRSQMRATWNGDAPTCEPRLCDEIPGISNGILLCNNANVLGSRCTITCDGEDYFLRGEASRTCEAVSDAPESMVKWNHPVPTCELITCPEVEPTSAYVTFECTNDFAFGTVCVFDCVDGYALEGDGETECGGPTSEIRGRWSHLSPTCSRIRCEPQSYDPLNGTTDCSEENLFQSICNYTCVTGYDLIGRESRHCRSDESWSDLEPICERKRCTSHSPFIENGISTCTEENFFGSICEYYCDLGFDMVGDRQAVCGEDEDGNTMFDNPPPTCQPIYCSLISGPVSGGRVVCGVDQGDVESNRYGTTCFLSCNDGWRTDGISRTTCFGFGEWDQTLGRCKRIECQPPLRKPPRGQMSCSDAENVPGTQCSFTCGNRLQLVGDDLITCTEEGKWSAESPICSAP